MLLAGVGNDTTVLKTEDAATTLFNSLVNVDNMNTGSGFANSNGNIVITSTVGTSVGANAKVRNYAANSNITINNTGASGVSIAGEVSNPNGTLAINNKGGELLVNTTGSLLNKGTMTLVNNGSGTGINLNGTIENTGNLTINNETGSNGLLVGGGTVTNNTGTANITNSKGLLKVAQGAKVTSNGTSLTVTNNATGSGMTIAGTVDNNAGTALIENKAGELLVDTTGLIRSKGTKLTVKNSGSGLRIAAGGAVENSNILEISNSGANGLNVLGSITNTGKTDISNTGAAGINLDNSGTITNNGSSLNITNSGASGINVKGLIKTTNQGTVNITNNDSNIVIGDSSSNNNYITSDGKVTITQTNGNVLNSGHNKTHIKTTNGANLVINVTNGAIGKEVGPCEGGICTGIGTNARDLTKSVNVAVDGTITAKSTKGTNTSLINMASLNKDMKVDQIKADGRVILLADDSANKGATAYNILNSASNAANPNVEGAGISIIASGNIGAANKALTFRQMVYHLYSTVTMLLNLTLLLMLTNQLTVLICLL